LFVKQDKAVQKTLC